MDTNARRALVAFASMVMLALFASPAFAHHATDHEGGAPDQAAGPSSSSSADPTTHEATVTEDNDDDGVPNAPDPEGDTDNAHPSGNDKHVEAGQSGNQGRATSDPDDDTRGPERRNGGVDQPGGTGGVDLLDQDGNNGCGNDDDFEDDNEGRCQGPRPPTTNECPQGGCPPPVCPQGGCPPPVCPQGGCPPPVCPQGGCPPPVCPQGGCPTQNPPIVAAQTEGPQQVGPAGVPAGGDDDDVAGPAAPVPVPELAFTGANVDFLVRGMLALALLGAALVMLGRIGRREEA
jgi:hypothetical protein